MVLNNINKNDSILLEVLASVFTVSSNFTDNPRIFVIKKNMLHPLSDSKLCIVQEEQNMYLSLKACHILILQSFSGKNAEINKSDNFEEKNRK